jgi:phosphoribosylcarboxyaminoimidazole (NCAIR) mutase
MPPGVPVASVGIGKAGARNAALLALEILALNDKSLEERLARYRTDMKKSVLEEDDSIKNL